jgi:hypothetical protein
MRRCFSLGWDRDDLLALSANPLSNFPVSDATESTREV